MIKEGQGAAQITADSLGVKFHAQTPEMPGGKCDLVEIDILLDREIERTRNALHLAPDRSQACGDRPAFCGF